MKRPFLVLTSLLLTALACGEATPPAAPSPTPTPDRLAAILAEAVKVMPETDTYPVKSETDEFADPLPLPFPVNTSTKTM